MTVIVLLRDYFKYKPCFKIIESNLNLPTLLILKVLVEEMNICNTYYGVLLFYMHATHLFHSTRPPTQNTHILIFSIYLYALFQTLSREQP